MATTVMIPDQLEVQLRAHAAQRQTTVDELVREALAWHLHMDPLLLDELSAWQEVREEALQITEDSCE